MKKAKIFLVGLCLFTLAGCTSSSPVAKTISLKNFDIVELGVATKTVCTNTESKIICTDIPDDDSYSISQVTKGDNRFSKIFVDDYDAIDKLLHTADAKNNDIEKAYLIELRGEYADWLTGNENYKFSLSRIKGDNGDTVKVSLILTDKGKESAKKLGYNFTDTSLQYKIINGQLVLQ